jgi:small neutral amino acid transporter SnatA (MarC family)
VTVGFAVLAFVAAVNPPRVCLLVPAERTTARARVELLALASLVVLILAAVGVAAADDLLAALDVSPESFRIAAGAVLSVAGLRVLVQPTAYDHPALPGRRAALVPLAFPGLVTPELTMLVLSAGVDEPAGRTLAVLALALVLATALAAVRRSQDAVYVATARLLGAALVVVGAGLVVDGIRDV